MNITLPSLNIGQYVKVHVKAYADDLAHNPSTTVDATTPLTLTTLAGVGVVNAAVDSGDNRAVIFTATAAGSSTIKVSNANIPGGGEINYSVTVNAPHVNNARLDHLLTDAPV